MNLPQTVNTGYGLNLKRDVDSGLGQVVLESDSNPRLNDSYLNKHDPFCTGQVESTIFPFTVQQENPNSGIGLEQVYGCPLRCFRINLDAADSICRQCVLND